MTDIWANTPGGKANAKVEFQEATGPFAAGDIYQGEIEISGSWVKLVDDDFTVPQNKIEIVEHDF